MHACKRGPLRPQPLEPIAPTMRTERHYGWMWLQALESSDRADKLRRDLLRYVGPDCGASSWEPPVDVFETTDGVLLRFALPGIRARDIEIRLERTMITVSAHRPLRVCDPEARIRRIETPHGRFARRIALSGPPLVIESTSHEDGCLEIRLRRISEHQVET